MATREKLAYRERHNHTRLLWVRRYPANSRWHGWLPPQAIEQLEEAGNTVKSMGDGTYMLNATVQNCQGVI